jgi:glycosyltransferase involved in cell wall biosynthesis
MLSVIITVFDEDVTVITECVDSLTTLKNLKQIIVINDNPSRTLGNINFEKNLNIKLCEDNTNRGISGARNYGLQFVSEKFVMFIDADDKVCAFNSNKFDLKNISRKIDIIYFNYVIKNEVDEIRVELTSNKEKLSLSGKSILLDYLNNCHSSSFFPFVWAKIYRTSFIKKNKIFFNERLFQYEDIDWLFQALMNCNFLLGVPITIYKKRNFFPSKRQSDRIILAGLSFVSVFSSLQKMKHRLKISEETLGYSISLFFVKRLGELNKNSLHNEKTISKFLKMGLEVGLIKNFISKIKIQDEKLKTLLEKEKA